MAVGVPDPEVAVDAVAIRQVIVNLLQNALEAVDEAAGKREVRLITRPSRNEPDWAELQIADSGPGLPDEGIEELFEPLVTHRAGGTGLGLAIVRSLVAAHEGEVAAKEAPGGGALLVVRLPLTAAQEEAA
jgi:two-component system NtrC family sensor kinase